MRYNSHRLYMAASICSLLSSLFYACSSLSLCSVLSLLCLTHSFFLCRLGVVTQNNSLWDRLSVEDHLFLFARLRGVPEELVKGVVTGTIDQLELTPHRYKLAMKLSGKMQYSVFACLFVVCCTELTLLSGLLMHTSHR